MSGAIPSLTLYALVQWTGTTFKVKMKTNSMIDDEEDDCDDTNVDIWYSD
jgi:hypothetical protein